MMQVKTTKGSLRQYVKGYLFLNIVTALVRLRSNINLLGYAPQKAIAFRSTSALPEVLDRVRVLLV